MLKELWHPMVSAAGGAMLHGAPELVVSMEEHGPVDVVRYSGAHCCRVADHERGEEVRAWLAERVRSSRGRFLLDVRGFGVFYGSGVGDLMNPFLSLCGRGAATVALVWKPGRPRGWTDRWAFFKLACSESEPLLKFLKFFESEAEALALLCSDQEESRPT